MARITAAGLHRRLAREAISEALVTDWFLFSFFFFRSNQEEGAAGGDREPRARKAIGLLDGAFE